MYVQGRDYIQGGKYVQEGKYLQGRDYVQGKNYLHMYSIYIIYNVYIFTIMSIYTDIHKRIMTMDDASVDIDESSDQIHRVHLIEHRSNPSMMNRRDVHQR